MRERHDLVGRHGDVTAPAESLCDPLPAGACGHCLTEDDRVVSALELDLGPGSDPERVTQLLRDRDLSFSVTFTIGIVPVILLPM